VGAGETSHGGGSRGGFERGTLRRSVQERGERAWRRGALERIPAEIEVIEDCGVAFLVRIASGIPALQAAHAGRMPAGANPFLPYDEDLFVADVSDTHVCLLNKFNVVDDHVLIVTRAFESQEDPLRRADLEALWTCTSELDGLGFYNAGRVAGASQLHRHLQVIPTPLSEGPGRTPIDSLLEDLRFDEGLGTARDLPFLHAVARLRSCAQLSPSEAADVLMALYGEMIRAFGCERPGRPYNLLLTREWMLFVPRTRAHWRGIPVNALGFAGALLVHDRDQLSQVREAGPMRLLRGVAVGRS
jgi:ATP adenylyltransferase